MIRSLKIQIQMVLMGLMGFQFPIIPIPILSESDCLCSSSLRVCTYTRTDASHGQSTG